MQNFNTNYPSISSLKQKAKKRIPQFAFDYLEGGCNDDINLFRNKAELQNIQLKPYYLRPFVKPDLQTNLLSQTYSAPFGIAPIGLQGLIWPGSAQQLARSAANNNIPFILSTVSTASIEEIAKITEGKAWFQLYHPAKQKMRNSIISRVQQAGMDVLVVLIDVPAFGYRPRDIRNGLAMPPKFTARNFFQIVQAPLWGIETLRNGIPQFATLKQYMPKGLSMAKLGEFMNQTFAGKIDEEKLSSIRDMWKGKLVVKGVVNPEDAEKAMRIGVDGIIVSNHGGRQIDAGESTIASLQHLVPLYKNKMSIMVDSGIRSGVDVARCMAAGADFTFLGRPFMYGTGALGKHGGEQTINILKKELEQVMLQLGCGTMQDLPQHLI